MRKVSLERNYFVLYNDALTLKMTKMALNPFCDKTMFILMHVKISSEALIPFCLKVMGVILVTKLISIQFSIPVKHWWLRSLNDILCPQYMDYFHCFLWRGNCPHPKPRAMDNRPLPIFKKLMN